MSVSVTAAYQPINLTLLILKIVVINKREWKALHDHTLQRESTYIYIR